MKRDDWELLRLAALMSTVGIAMVIATFIGLYVGVVLDRRLGTPPATGIVYRSRLPS